MTASKLIDTHSAEADCGLINKSDFMSGKGMYGKIKSTIWHRGIDLGAA